MYLDKTLLNDIQDPNVTSARRPDRLGIVQAVKAGESATSSFIPQSVRNELQTISDARKIQLPVIKDGEVTVTTSPGFSIPANLQETEFYFFQPYSVFSGLRYYPSMHQNNVVEGETYKREQTLRVLEFMGKKKEEIIASQLEVLKTRFLDHTLQVSQGDGTFNFDTVSDTLNINKAAQKETMYYNLQTLMRANKQDGTYRIVTNPAGLSVQMAEQAKYASGNEKDLANLGFYALDKIYDTDSITTTSNIFDGWLLRDGSIGTISNYPWDFRNGTVVGEKKWEVTDVEMPYLQSRVNVFSNREASNTQSLVTSAVPDSNGLMSHFEEMAMWDHFYIVYPYNQNRDEYTSDIVKISGLTT